MSSNHETTEMEFRVAIALARHDGIDPFYTSMDDVIGYENYLAEARVAIRAMRDVFDAALSDD